MSWGKGGHRALKAIAGGAEGLVEKRLGLIGPSPPQPSGRPGQEELTLQAAACELAHDLAALSPSSYSAGLEALGPTYTGLAFLLVWSRDLQNLAQGHSLHKAF